MTEPPAAPTTTHHEVSQRGNHRDVGLDGDGVGVDPREGHRGAGFGHCLPLAQGVARLDLDDEERGRARGHAAMLAGAHAAAVCTERSELERLARARKVWRALPQ